MRLAQPRQRGDIEHVTRGVYRLTRYPISLLAQYVEAALWPQVRRPDARGAISHESALAIYGLSDASPVKVHVTLPTMLRIRRAVPKRLAPHYADLTPKDLQQVDGAPVTTAARAIRDAHANHRGLAPIRQAIHDGRRTGYLTLNAAERLEHELVGTKPRRQNRRTKSIRGCRVIPTRKLPTGPSPSAGVARTTRCASGPALPPGAFFEVVATIANDDVVEYLHAEQRAGINETASQLNVVRAGAQIAAGAVVRLMCPN